MIILADVPGIKNPPEVPPVQRKSRPLTCVASEYGVRESLFTSNDPNVIGTPEELEGLSCCVGTIFGPLPKELSTCTSPQLNHDVKSATRITIPRALRPLGERTSTIIYLSSGHPRRSITSSRPIGPPRMSSSP